MVHIKVLANGSQSTKYREPIVAFADVDDPEFEDIKNITHENHMLPKGLCMRARLAY